MCSEQLVHARPLLKTRQSSISINGEAHNTRAQWQTLRLITGNFAIQFPPTALLVGKGGVAPLKNTNRVSRAIDARLKSRQRSFSQLTQ
jgi:hypothetical protein